jgi:hypothetical protein
MVELTTLPEAFRTPGMPQRLPNAVSNPWVTSGWYAYPAYVYYP